jgi:holo-[acyl-carrier protein] synthase
LIFGIGIDLIEVARIEKQIDSQTRFKTKIFSKKEIEYCESFKANRTQHYAARYAAKEAFFKALGSGYRGGLKFAEISIENDDLGKPVVVLSGGARDLAESQRFANINVSLSHVKEYACAIVIIET